MPTVAEILKEVSSDKNSERELAIGLHDAVRDRIKFGFNRYFDDADPDFTLSCGAGHCNPKSRLMVDLFRAAGFEAYQHFVVIPRDILFGVIPSVMWWLIPAELSHSYIEVKVGDNWCDIDSYIVDSPLLKGAQAWLAREGRAMGYGARIDSANRWDGQTRAFSQFDASMLIEDHGRITNFEEYFHSRRYRNRAFGIRFNTTFKMMGDRMVKLMNSHIDQIRLMGSSI